MRTRAVFEVSTVESNRPLWQWVLLPTTGVGFDQISFTLPGGKPCEEPEELVGGWRELFSWQVRDSDIGGK